MTMFSIVTVVVLAVAATYLAYGIRAFIRVRRDILQAAGAGRTEVTDDLPDELHSGFVWKALGGVAASTGVIVLMGVDSVFWYLPIFLAIGSAVAVITAFIIDNRVPAVSNFEV